jgi:hypothetical protein
MLNFIFIDKIDCTVLGFVMSAAAYIVLRSMLLCLRNHFYEVYKTVLTVATYCHVNVLALHSHRLQDPAHTLGLFLMNS